MLSITEQHISRFINLKEMFFSQTKVPKENNWQSLSDNDIWLRFIIQILIVGSSAPAQKFDSNDSFKEMVSYSRLQNIVDDKDKMKIIHYVLREIGCRYVGEDINKGWKVKSLVYNFNKLQQFDGGPTEFLLYLERLIKNNSDKQAIETLKRMKGFKDKSSRDFLMEYGMISNCIALDIRLYNVFTKLGVSMPSIQEIHQKSKIYNEVEKEILEFICKPIGLSGIELDRMLYQNYDNILKAC